MGPGDPLPPLCQTKLGPKGPKKKFLYTALPPYRRLWMTPPPPPPFLLIIKISLSYILNFQVIIKAIFIVSYVGNRGTFERNIHWLLSDRNLVLHLMYFTFGVLGFTVHTFFYSILVSVRPVLASVKQIQEDTLLHGDRQCLLTSRVDEWKT